MAIHPTHSVRPRPRSRVAVTLAALSLAAISSSAPAHDIMGTVTALDGQPVAGAVITIESTAVTATENSDLKWCHPDCGKHGLSDADGFFTIRTTTKSSMLHVSALNCFSRVVTATSQLPQPLHVALATRGSVPDSSGTQFAGQVLGRDGQPVAGAHVSEDRYVFTTTDDYGRFFLISRAAVGSRGAGRPLRVTVEAPGAMAHQSFNLIPGKLGNTLQLRIGTTVRGRVLKDARPCEGVTVVVRTLEPRTGDRRVVAETVSDRAGRFTLEHIEPNREMVVFTRMQPLAGENRATIARTFYSAGPRQVTEVGELNLHPAHRIRGRVIFAEPLDPMPKLEVTLSRVRLSDRQQVDVDADGNFVIEGVPTEAVVLEVHAAGYQTVPGYHLSPQHYALDPSRRLCGRVDEDVDLIVLFERGPSPQIDNDNIRRQVIQQQGVPQQAIQQQVVQRQVVIRRNGVQQIVAVQNGQIRDPMLDRQLQLLSQPLRGIPPEMLDR